MSLPDCAIGAVRASAYRIPTDQEEADGTLRWDATTLVLVELEAGNRSGLGYTYADASLVRLIDGELRPHIEGADAMAPGRLTAKLDTALRNLGHAGLAACALSAIDCAAWDLKARLLELPLASLLGLRRDSLAVYGSGGFLTYDDRQLREQLGHWAEEDGCRWVKMKIGLEPERELARIRDVLDAIGEAMLFVDANGAYDCRQAISLARHMTSHGIGWFEEPVCTDDLAGLRRVRDALDAAGMGMDIAAGQYANTAEDVQRMLQAGAVDVLQADLSRCGGVTGFLRTAALCEAHRIDLSAAGAPALHLAVACAAPRLRHIEWLHDHVRIEQMLFDGAPHLKRGCIAPDLGAPGHGLSFRHPDAEPYRL